MKTLRTAPALLATALLSLAAPGDALADPDTSPFSERDVVKLNGGNLDKINLASCNIKLVNKVSTKWYRYVFNAAAVGNELKPGGGVACDSGKCIKVWKANASNGPWAKLPDISSLANASDAAQAVHCNTTTTGDTNDYEWHFWGGTFSNPSSIPLTPSSSASHVANTYANWPSEWMGICRAVYLGATYVGTLRNEYDNDFMVWRDDEGRFVSQSTSGNQTRQTCSVRLDSGNLKRFHNFQVLLGDIGEAEWKNPTSSGNAPSNSFLAGKLDTKSVYACVAHKTYYSSGSNPTYLGTKRVIGWWQPGDDECHAPLFKGSNINGVVTSTGYKVLTN